VDIVMLSPVTMTTTPGGLAFDAWQTTDDTTEYFWGQTMALTS